MPLTDNGWEELTLDQALANEQTRFKTWLGQETDLSPHSPWGKLCMKEAQDDVDDDQQLEMVYDSGYASQADGVSLDRLASNYGLQRKLSQAAKATLQVTGTPGYLIEADTRFMTSDGTEFLNAYDTQIGEGGTTELLVYSDDEADYVNVDANTINQQAEPVEDIFDVNNAVAAVGGADLEQDYDFRKRILPNEVAAENGTKDGLKVAMLNVTGVSDAQVIRNPDGEVDSYGNPPHSMHIYVMGGDPDAIAQKILDVAGGETLFVGKSQGTAIDDSGHQVIERFDQEELVNVKFDIKIQSSSGIDEDAVKQSVLDYLGSLAMGSPVIINKLYSYLYQIDGVDYVESISAGTGDTMGTENITFSDYQLAKSTDELITLEVTASA